MSESKALQRDIIPDSESVAMFERLARDPNVDPEKLERLIALQERIMRHNAKAAFDGAFSKMQPKIPVITENGRIEVRGTVRSTYAPLEDIHDVVKPILAEHGFAIRHRTEWPKDGIIRIVGILSHEQGHSEETAFEAPLDKSEYRTEIQSMGSTVSYGRRYTTLDLLNISTRKADNDGQKVTAEGLIRFKELPEALRNRIEKAFAACNMTEGQRLMRLNEFLLKPNAVPEEAAEKLLEWCKAEYARRENRVYKPGADQNGKPKPKQPEPPKDAESLEFT